MIEVALLKELLEYLPDEGKFIRRVKRGPFEAGTEAGSKSLNGKVYIQLGASKVSASAAAYAYMTGAWPAKRVTHLNGIPDDFRWPNLYVQEKRELTADVLRSMVTYDPDTGVFTRLHNTSPKGRAGAVAGSYSKGKGYVEFNVDGSLYSAHRLAWLYMTGEWPREDVDHINGDKADNRWANLRDVDNATNMQNMRKAIKTNKSTGLLGVTYCKQIGRFKAQIKHSGKRRHIGVYATAEEAHQAYIQVKRAVHPGCTL